MSGGTEKERPAQDPPSRGRSPIVVASVAAAVLLAGGGGAYLAAAPGDGKGGPAAAPLAASPAPLALDDHAAAGADAPVSSGTGGSGGIAPGEPDPSGVVYVASGALPKGPERAPVYRARGEVSADQTRTLARALGLRGEPRAVGAVWKVGPDADGSGGSLEVARQAPGTWSYGAFGGGADGSTGDDCQKGKICDPGAGGTARGSGGEGTGGAPVSEEAARKAAAPVLAAAGQGDAATDATQVTGSVRAVNADPVVGGLPSYGWSTGVQVGPDGRVTGASGRLAAPAKDAEYPVIGAERALELLNRPAQGAPPSIGGCATPVPAEEDAAGGSAPGKEALPGDDGQVTCAPAASPAPRQRVTVDRAVFGLAAHFSSGRPVLVPSWLFSVRPQAGERPFTITYPAVDPKLLAPAPSASPAPPDAPEPGASDPAAASPGRVESFTEDGRILTARFYGGVCSTFTLRAEESAEQVRLTVVERATRPGQACIAIAKEQSAQVTLEAPVGDRRVVDAPSGERVKRR
ncbi:hypothetical protein [Streptomyces sp. ODS05-4]|uniref:hypothetical protein n=1 Tax=Streptomyces sp. ODS05-4 TaxID=2944939 RepID=UPI00210C0C79|nr:hypothetical protein [Streptomyces sp. ODS05-4]